MLSTEQEFYAEMIALNAQIRSCAYVDVTSYLFISVERCRIEEEKKEDKIFNLIS